MSIFLIVKNLIDYYLSKKEEEVVFFRTSFSKFDKLYVLRLDLLFCGKFQLLRFTVFFGVNRAFQVIFQSINYSSFPNYLLLFSTWFFRLPLCLSFSPSIEGRCPKDRGVVFVSKFLTLFSLALSLIHTKSI